MSMKANSRSIFSQIAFTLLGVTLFSLCLLPTAQGSQKLRDDLLSVSFPTEKEGFACGRRGTILHTTDGGTTWTSLQSGTKRTLTTIRFVDALNGWAAGEAGIILNTKDGGKTWQQQKSPVDYFLMDAEFVNKQKGWIVGEKTTILATDDGGNSWRVQFKDEDFVLKGVSFCDDHNGWAVGEFGYTYHTDNGGRTWTKQAGEFKFSEATGEMEGGTYLFNILAVDPKTAWAVGIDGHIAVTKDGGRSWNKVAKGVAKTHLFSIASDGKGSFYIAGSGILLGSHDGGSTFKELKAEPAPTYGWLYNISARGKAGLVTVGHNGWIYLSDEKGEAWRRVN